jgi:hypothetical protein
MRGVKRIVGCYDIVDSLTRPVEIDPEIPFYFRRADGETPEYGVSFTKFSKDGQPILFMWGIAAQFEREALTAFQAACGVEAKK